MKDDDLNDNLDSQISLIDKKKVPKELHELIPQAQKWGICEDGVRFIALRKASDKDLSDLIKINLNYGNLLDVWLAGPEAYEDNFSEEYITFTVLRMASDEAVIVLEKRKSY